MLDLSNLSNLLKDGYMIVTHLGDLSRYFSTSSIIVEGIKSVMKPIASMDELCARSLSAGLDDNNHSP